MLSLKSATVCQAASTKINLLDLPAELIGTILTQLPFLDDLLPASLVSRRLREEALPILFHSINLTFTTNARKNGKTILDYFLENPRLCRHIREVIVRTPVAHTERQRTELWKFEKVSWQMQNLRVIQYLHMDSLFSLLLTNLTDRAHGMI